MPRLKYVEVSNCPMLKEFEVPHHLVGIWRLPTEEEEDLETVRLEDEIVKLKRLTLHKLVGLSTIAIVGMYEEGEDGIAHKFFYNTEVELDFGVRIWVSLSHEYNILKDILDKINEGQRREYQGDNDHRLLNHINESLLNKKFWLVLNAVGSLYDGWLDRFFDALLKGNGSCVIITTEIAYLAKRMKGVKDLIYRPCEESWLLFSKIAFEETGGRCRYPELAEVAKEIVVKCRKEWRAIELMAGLVRHTPPQDYARLKDFVDVVDSQLLHDSLNLGYDFLPPSLKLFMLIFPSFMESMTLEVERLIYWWVGGGFASTVSGKTTLESAYDSLSEFVSRRFMNVVDKRNYDGRIYTCTCFIDYNLEKIKRDKWLYIFGSKCVFISRQNTRLRVVDLSFSNFESKDELSWICSLEHLTCLILKGMKGIKELPAGIMTRTNLTVLDTQNCTSLRYLPKGLGKLFNLQVLSGFHPAISTSTDGSPLKDLENLTQLRILCLSISEENQIDDVEVDLSSLKDLKLLDVSIENSRETGNLSRKLDQLSPPACLQELYLRGFKRETGPTWLKPASLPGLEYLCIENGNLKVLSINTTEKWKEEGLYLKLLPRLELEWKILRSVMPCLKYVEVNGCYMLKGFEIPYVHLDGIWRLPKEEEEEEE